MKSFKDTTYGDMTGQDYRGTIDIRGQGLDSWEGASTTFYGEFYAAEQCIKSLEYIEAAIKYKGSEEIIIPKEIIDVFMF